MFTIDRGSSCINFGIANRCDSEKIIRSISESIKLAPFIDVVIAKEAIDNDVLYNNAKLYVDFYYMPGGVSIFCDICSANIHEIITDWYSFLKILSVKIDSDIYIDFHLGKVYTIMSNGDVQEGKYTTKLIDEVECVFIDKKG
jgi:hypothetical protein